MSLFSPRKAAVRQVEHIQNSVKLRRSEIDATFLAVEELPNGASRRFIITCEAKRRVEDFSLDQIRKQPLAIFDRMPEQTLVIPLAVKAIAPSIIHVVEFAAFERETAEDSTLQIVSQAVYELHPPVPGIGQR
jgi:hypothetical protein